jgi:hypothetical protein
MPSSKAPLRAVSLVVSLVATSYQAAMAQQSPHGFAVERFYPSAPGGGWMVMDDLDMRGGLGGVIALSGGYAFRPLRLATTDGSQHLTLVSDQAFADIGMAVTYDRYRLYLNLTNPVVIDGEGGTIGDYRFTGPSVDIGSRPDLVADPRLGFDVRLLGSARSSFRLGAGAQLLIPNGDRSDYDTDDTFRGMVRALVAGNRGRWSYAGHVGVHLRPLDDSPIPGSPRGSELLFGIAGGPRFALGRGATMMATVGPEIYGETAFRSFLNSTATGLEALLTGRFERGDDGGPQIRIKLSSGGGISAHFGAPEWRMVFAIELLEYTSICPPSDRTLNAPSKTSSPGP